MISLIHPSRGRPTKAHDTAMNWIYQAGVETELILSLDRDDPHIKDYQRYLPFAIINDNQNLVEATNNAAKAAKGEILLYLSDDFQCFQGWGAIIEREFAKYPDVPILLKVDDCLQKFDVAVLTIPIMNRSCYETLGYFFHPDFKSMHCDEQLYWRAKKLGFLKMAPHIKFEHCHVSVGKAENDETYKRSAANWDHGKATLAKHKSEGFIR